MLKRDRKIQLIEEKRTSLSLVRTVLIAILVLMAGLVSVSVMVFSCVHGTMSS